MISYCTIWYHIVQYDIILYNMISYCTILYHSAQYDIILYYLTSYCTIWCHIAQYDILLNMISYCTIWYNIVQYDIILYTKIMGVYYILHYFTYVYRKIDKMHMLARNFAPARNTDRQKSCFFIVFYTILHDFAEQSIKCTFLPGILPLQGTPTGKNNGWGPWARGPMGPLGPWAQYII